MTAREVSPELIAELERVIGETSLAATGTKYRSHIDVENGIEEILAGILPLIESVDQNADARGHARGLAEAASRPVPPLARSTDPETSRSAAEATRPRVRRPGGAYHKVLKVYGAQASLEHTFGVGAPGLTHAHGMTSREAEKWSGVRAAHKRTSDLLRDGCLEVVNDVMADGILADLVRDGGRVLRITDTGRAVLERLDARA